MRKKVYILNQIVDDMLETLKYKNYTKEEIEGAKECSKFIKQRISQLYENDENADNPHFSKDEYSRLQYCLSNINLSNNPKSQLYFASKEKEGAKKFILAIKSKARILKD